MKLVINRTWGGFQLSQKALKKLIEYGVPKIEYEDTLIQFKNGHAVFPPDLLELYIMKKPWDNDLQLFPFPLSQKALIKQRSHPLLIKVVEELGEDADGNTGLSIEEVDDDLMNQITIKHYDGQEEICYK